MEFKVPENKRELFIKTSIWNSIIEVFKEKKEIDITNYLISVQIKWNNILIKTNKPIINTEALILHHFIIEKAEKKLKSMNIDFKWFDIKYI